MYQNSKPVTGYQTANGVTYYFNSSGVLSSKAGIDVSKFQGDIDWNKVKNDGVEFAIIRIGYRGYGSAGTIAKDPKFLQNIINATNVGIDCGLYFFTQATTKAEAEEEAVLGAVELAAPPQAARLSAAAPTPAAFRKLRREMRFIVYPPSFDLVQTQPGQTGSAREGCVFFCLQYKFFRLLEQGVCCFFF